MATVFLVEENANFFGSKSEIFSSRALSTNEGPSSNSSGRLIVNKNKEIKTIKIINKNLLGSNWLKAQNSVRLE